MSGALNVRLGGDNWYDGELIPAPVMGKEFSNATPAKAHQAIRLTAGTGIVGLVAGILIAVISKSRRAQT
jgi:adenosylcobinamide-phosphate synthase